MSNRAETSGTEFEERLAHLFGRVVSLISALAPVSVVV